VETWIACGDDAYSTQEIYDLLRAILGKGRGVEWLPHWLWQLGASLIDIVLRRSGEPTYDKLFGTELYSNAAVVKDTGWRPRIKLEDAMSLLGAARSGDW
jgi:nucleoside-diphosphate-sugar epimerase